MNIDDLLFIYFPTEDIRRLEYSARHFFNNILNVDILIIREREIFLMHDGACINYSDEDLNHGLWIVPHGLLSEKGVRKIPDIEVFRWNDYFCFFKQERGDIPFDPFAASFYLLTLYEEYFPKQLDEHGRFDPKESLAYRNGFLEIPIIDRWAYLLKEELEKRYPDAKIKKKRFRLVSTFDIDHPYLYLKKGLLRSLGGMIRDMRNKQWEDVKLRIAVHLRRKPDPYMEALRWIDRIHKKACKPYFLFVLMKDRGKYGRKTLYPLIAYYRYLKKLDSVTIGLHPSYDTYRNLEQLITEKKRFERVFGEDDVLISRQHFLRMRVPQTLRQLNALGFRADYSVTFARMPGFRSGTAVSYYFYDVENDTNSMLLLRPTVVMDTCLITHMGLRPEEAIEKIKRLIDECKQSEGDFLSLWHNSNLTGNRDDNPWINVFIESLRYATSLEE